MTGEMQQRRVESDRLALSLQDGALEVVIEQDPRHADPGLESSGVTAQEILHAGIEKEAQEDLSRPRQYHHESHQRPAGAADIEMTKVGPVDLSLFTGQRAQPQVGFGGGPRSVQGEQVPEMIGLPAVAAALHHDV
jgi:hypothetical protein